MNTRNYFLLFFAFASISLKAQVGIGAPNTTTNGILKVTSVTKGALFPRMTASERIAISSPAKGLLVYDTDSNSYVMYNGSTWKSIVTQENNRNIGMIGAFASSSLPAGWLELNGQSVASSSYPSLAARYPSWISGSNIVLPDYRGYFLRGTGTNGSNASISGPSAGSVQNYSTAQPGSTFTMSSNGDHNHTATLSTDGNHTHNWTDDGSVQSPKILTLAVLGSKAIRWAGTTAQRNTSTDADHTHTMTIASAGTHSHSITGGGDTETRPYNISVLWAIKVY